MRKHIHNQTRSFSPVQLVYNFPSCFPLAFCSVLETEKSLVLAEKGSGDDDDVELLIAGKKFRLVATMNPGGDFGKKEVCSESKTDSLLFIFFF